MEERRRDEEEVDMGVLNPQRHPEGFEIEVGKRFGVSRVRRVVVRDGWVSRGWRFG